MTADDQRALIFDFDGLMVDSERVLAEAIVEHIAGLGGRVTFEDMAHLFGSTEVDHLWEELLPVWAGRPHTLAEFEAAIWSVVPAMVDELPLLPGVEDLIVTARDAGWKVGLGTGSSRRNVERRLARLGVLDHLDALVTSKEAGRGKPAPDVFLAVADRLGVEPRSCVVLEDSVPGCQAATAAGMRVIACPSAVNAHLDFPPDARRVASLVDVRLDLLVDETSWGTERRPAGSDPVSGW